MLDANGLMTEKDQMYQFGIAVGEQSDIIFDWLETISEASNTFANFKKKLLEKNDRMKLWNRTTAPKSENFSRTTTEERQDKMQETKKGPRCFGCNELGHKINKCPKAEKLKEKGEKEHSQEKQLDWTDFKNMKLSPENQNMKKTHSMCAVVKEEIGAESDVDVFLLDSGPGYHMTNNINDLEDILLLKSPIQVESANQNSLIGTHLGTMKVVVKNRENVSSDVTFSNVVYVLGLSMKLYIRKPYHYE